MNNVLRGVIIFLLIVVAFFLLGLLFWLYRCGCCGRKNPWGTSNTVTLNTATAEPQRPSGKYPPFQVPKEDFNKDHPRVVPTGPQRGALAPTVGGSKLQP